MNVLGYFWSPLPYFSRLIAPENLPNLILCVVGIAGVFVAVRTLKNIEKQTTASDVASNAAKISADAAYLTAQVMIDTERALVEVDLGEPSTDIDPETGEHIFRRTRMDTGDYRYGIKVTNHGKTVAHIISYAVSSDCLESNFHRDKMSYSTRVNRHILLAAGKSDTIGDFGAVDLFSNAEWKSIRAGDKTGLMRFDVEYYDVIKAEKSGSPHETSAVFRWNVHQDEPDRLTQYNIYT